MHSTAVSKSKKTPKRKIHTSKLGLETAPTRKSNVRDVTRQQSSKRGKINRPVPQRTCIRRKRFAAFDKAEGRYCANSVIYQETTFELCMNVWCKLTFASTSFIFAKQCQIVCLRHEASDLPSFIRHPAK